MLESLFNKVAGLQAYNFIKKILQHRCFPMNFTKFLRTPFFYGTLPVTPLGWLSFWEYSTNVNMNKYLFIDGSVQAKNAHNYNSNSFPQNKGNNLEMGHDEVQTKSIAKLGDVIFMLRNKVLRGFLCF